MTERQKYIKEKFIRDRGAWKWSPMWDTILELDEDIVEAYATYSSIADKRGYLDIRMRKFIFIAIDCITGSLNVSGLKNHMKHALQLGIDKREILEVLEIASMIGATTYTMGVPMLMRAMKERGTDLADQALTEKQTAIKEKYIAAHTEPWTEEKEHILLLDPEYFDAFSDFEDVPMKGGVLSPKEKELIYIAVHGAPVTLNQKELDYHINRALDLGADMKEIIEVFALISTLGIHSITIGVPVLKEALSELENT